MCLWVESWTKPHQKWTAELFISSHAFNWWQKTSSKRWWYLSYSFPVSPTATRFLYASDIIQGSTLPSLFYAKKVCLGRKLAGCLPRYSSEAHLVLMLWPRCVCFIRLCWFRTDVCQDSIPSCSAPYGESAVRSVRFRLTSIKLSFIICSKILLMTVILCILRDTYVKVYVNSFSSQSEFGHTDKQKDYQQCPVRSNWFSGIIIDLENSDECVFVYSVFVLEVVLCTIDCVITASAESWFRRQRQRTTSTSIHHLVCCPWFCSHLSSFCFLKKVWRHCAMRFWS